MKKCLPASALVVTHKFTCQNFNQAGVGGGGLFLEFDQKLNQKRDQANVKFRKLFPKILSQAEHKKFQSRFLLE